MRFFADSIHSVVASAVCACVLVAGDAAAASESRAPSYREPASQLARTAGAGAAFPGANWLEARRRLAAPRALLSVPVALPAGVTPGGVVCGSGSPHFPFGWPITWYPPYAGTDYAFLLTRAYAVYDDTAGFDDPGVTQSGWMVQSGSDFYWISPFGPTSGPHGYQPWTLNSGWTWHMVFVSETYVSTDGTSFDGPYFRLEPVYGPRVTGPNSCFFDRPPE